MRHHVCITISAVSAPATGISFEGLSKSYRTSDGPVHAVRGIDLSISVGETVALLGPNGAGKSTTIDMLLGLAEPDGGEVRLLGPVSRQQRQPRSGGANTGEIPGMRGDQRGLPNAAHRIGRRQVDLVDARERLVAEAVCLHRTLEG